MRPSILPAILLGALLPIPATTSAMPSPVGAVGSSASGAGGGMAGDLGIAFTRAQASPTVGTPKEPSASASPAASPAIWMARHCGELGPTRDTASIRVCSSVHLPTGGETPLSGLARSLRPIEQPLSRLLPDDALAAWDLGASPAAVADLVAQVLREVAPEQHRWLQARLSELNSAGIDPATELLPALGHGVGGGLLPPDPGDASWRLPRPVWLVRVEDEQAVARALPGLLRWWAGAVADLSGGLTSAVPVREELWGVVLTGLQIEGVLDRPLPSPTLAVTGGLLIVSPVRSAVRDVLAEIGTRAAIDTTDQASVPPGTVALLRAEPRAMAAILGPELPRLARLASAAGLPAGGLGAEPAERLARTVLRLASCFEQVTGSAVLVPGDDGAWLLLERDLRLAQAP
jgi:hypothetical protein